MKPPRNDRRDTTDLATRYNPLGLRAVISAVLQVKARELPGK